MRKTVCLLYVENLVICYCCCNLHFERILVDVISNAFLKYDEG